MKRLSLLIIVTLIYALCLTGCSAQADPRDVDNAPDISPFEPVTEISEGRRNIYLIIKVMDSSYWQVIVDGVRAAGNDMNCNIYCGGTNKETDWQGQRILIDEAVKAGADAVVLAPDDSIELSPDIDRLHEKGIPVALIDTAANTESFDVCYMTDNLFAGQEAAAEMLRQLHEAGYSDYDSVSAGILVGSSTSQTINERLAGFYRYWANNAPGKWNIISDIMDCNGDIDKGYALTEEFIENHPDVKGLFATNNGPTRALCNFVRENERCDITIVGFDFSDEIRELINSENYRASTILQRQYYMGYYGVEAVLGILDGSTPPLRFIDTGVVTVNRGSLSNPEVREIIELN